MKKVILIYGLISGVLITTFMLISVSLMMNGNDHFFDNGEIYGYTAMLVASSFIFLGIKRYRDKETGGFITFGKAFLLGLGITLVASIIYTGSWMVYSYTVETNFTTKYLQFMERKMVKDGKSPEVVAQKMAESRKMMENYDNPFVKAGFTILEIFPVGFLVTLVSAVILRRKEPQQAI